MKVKKLRESAKKREKTRELCAYFQKTPILVLTSLSTTVIIPNVAEKIGLFPLLNKMR